MYKQGEIVLIPLPFSDLSSSKRRPVLILSNDTYNRETDDILVCAITSQLSNKEYCLRITAKDLKQGILPKDSDIRADKIYTMSQSIVVKRFGEVNGEILDKLKNKINTLIQ